MFWKFTLNSSHIDVLLDNEEVTLHEIMDEEDVLQECKGQNKKLIDFLMKNDVMEEMIELITTEPAEDSDEKSKYKYPNLACELLTCDLTAMNERLSGDEALLNRIYCFLEQESPLNPLLASFFSKVFVLLISRRSEDMVEYIKKKENFISLVLKHLGTSAIMDLILRLITSIESSETRLAVIKWLNEQQLIEKLVALIDPSVPEDKHFNVSQLLCDIIRAGREQLSQLQDASDSDPLLSTTENPETVKVLLNHMLDNEVTDGPVIINGLAVLQTLLDFRKSIPFGMDPEQIPQVDDENHQKNVNKIIGAIIPRLGDLHQILLNPPQQAYSQMSTTVGSLNPPLGNARLQVCQLVSTIVGNNHLPANMRLAELKTVQVLLDLYHDYPWNNFLHTQITKCIASILLNEPYKEEDDSTNYALLDQLIKDVKLIEKVLDWWEENEQIQSEPLGHRRGYMGHLTKTANDVVAAVEKGPSSVHLKDLLEGQPQEIQAKWNSFANGPLAEVNKKNTIDLVGPHPLQSSSEDDDADFRGIPFPSEAHLQQAFADYQLQQMTSTFIDQFGFSEEEFGDQQEDVNGPFNRKIDFSINTDEEPPNAALFERACNERIQQFDDPDSDEDIWEDRNLTSTTGTDTSPQPHLRHAGQSDEDSSSDEDLDSPAVIRQTPSTEGSKPIGVPSLIPAEGMDVDAETWVNEDSVPVAMDTTPVAWAASDVPKSGEGSWASFGGGQSPVGHSDGWANFDQLPPANMGGNWANFSDFTPMESMAEPSTRMDVSENTASRMAAYAVCDMDTNTNGSATTTGDDLQLTDIADDEALRTVVTPPRSPRPIDDDDEEVSPRAATPPRSLATQDDAASPTAVTPPRSPNHTKENDLELQENFSFLHRAGLMKAPDGQKSPKKSDEAKSGSPKPKLNHSV